MRVWLLLSKATRYSVLSVLSSAVLSHESCKVLVSLFPRRLKASWTRMRQPLSVINIATFKASWNIYGSIISATMTFLCKAYWGDRGEIEGINAQCRRTFLRCIRCVEVIRSQGNCKSSGEISTEWQFDVFACPDGEMIGRLFVIGFATRYHSLVE